MATAMACAAAESPGSFRFTVGFIAGGRSFSSFRVWIGPDLLEQLGTVAIDKKSRAGHRCPSLLLVGGGSLTVVLLGIRVR